MSVEPRIRTSLSSAEGAAAVRERLARAKKSIISGAVAGSDGKPLARAVVTLELQPTSEFLSALSEGEGAAIIHLGTVTTDIAGRYTATVPLDFSGLDGYTNINGLSTVTVASFGRDGVASVDVAVPSVSGGAQRVQGSLVTAQELNELSGISMGEGELPTLTSVDLVLVSSTAEARLDAAHEVGARELNSAPASSGWKCTPPAAGFGGPSGYWEKTGAWKDVNSVVQTMHTGAKVKAEYEWAQAKRTEFQLAGVLHKGSPEVGLGWDVAGTFGHSHTWTVKKNKRKDAAVVYRWRHYRLKCFNWDYSILTDIRTKWFPDRLVGTDKFNSRQPNWGCNSAYRTRLASRSVISRDRTTTASFGMGTKFSSALNLGVRQTKTGSHKLTYDPGSGKAWVCGRGANWPEAREAKEVA